MRLNRALVRSGAVLADAPRPELLDLPEKAVQFGTGAFVRGFVDFFLDEANRQGRFGGRVVAVGSTGSGRDHVLNEQDGLYTLAIQGVENGSPRQTYRVIGSVSRAVSARDHWDTVLECARNPQLELVFSNTTEVGIVLDEGDDPSLAPPRSFPGKLARFLYERARAFDYDAGKGVVVLPCELIEKNGEKLREIVLALAARWELGDRFTRWIETAVPFCNTLVDRIVPGAPSAEQAEAMRRTLGYEDGLATTCELYRLFAIQYPIMPGGPLSRATPPSLRAVGAARNRLSFAGADPGIIIADDIEPYRERKVRLLNGAHTIMVPTALLCGCETVAEAVGHELVGRFVRRVMFDEIAPHLEVPLVRAYAREVLYRFANPYIRHALIDITLHATMKMRVRIIPSITAFAEHTGQAPSSLAFGFAAYLLFMRGDVQERRRQGGLHVPDDSLADRVRAHWSSLADDSDASLAALARAACADASLWGTDLTQVAGFADAVAEHLVRAHRSGVPAALEAHFASYATATHPIPS